MSTKTKINLLLLSPLILIALFGALFSSRNQSPVSAQTPTPTPSSADWYMAGANPQRTSWVSEEVREKLVAEWYIPIRPYISPKVQVIAAYNTLYIATARGLYAVDAGNGFIKWVYPTELPLGHSPTVWNDVVYVGGFDHKIHAMDATPNVASLQTDPTTGYKINTPLWKFEAEKGFQTNPLIADNKLFAGNRDGYMYALNLDGSLAWKYKTGGPVLYSAAYKSGELYFASDDMHAYALRTNNGSVVWKSQKFPGSGFSSWWPVVYTDPISGQDFVIFSGSENYRDTSPYGLSHISPWGEKGDLYADESQSIDPLDRPIVFPTVETYIGTKTQEADGTLTIDMNNRTINYLEEPTSAQQSTDPAGFARWGNKPWRRSRFYLYRSNGQEYTFDSDGDGLAEYAPLFMQWTHGGTRYPPIVAGDNLLYQTTGTRYSPNLGIPRGTTAVWDIGTTTVRKAKNDFAIDEPLVYTAGGNLIYRVLCCDRMVEAYDITNSNTLWRYWTQGGSRLDGDGTTDSVKLPGYNELVYWGKDDYPGHWTPVFNYGLGISDNDHNDPNNPYYKSSGIYGTHGDQSPFIPYTGAVYTIKSNVLLKLVPNAQWVNAEKHSMAEVVTMTQNTPTVTKQQLQQVLEAEVQKIIDAGHLQPGYVGTGIADGTLNASKPAGYEAPADHFGDYWKNPGDMFYALIKAYPHLSSTLQNSVRTYLDSEYANFSPVTYVHSGWAEGVQREQFDRPPEVEVNRVSFVKRTTRQSTQFKGWVYPQHQFYALWKYADLRKQHGDTAFPLALYNASKNRLEVGPTDLVGVLLTGLAEENYLRELPYVLNAYIAGYTGYIKLAELAKTSSGADQNAITADIQAKQSRLNTLITLRKTIFSKFSPYTDKSFNYSRELNISRNFMFLVPELATELRNSKLADVQDAVNEYNNVAPYWFVSRYEGSVREGVTSPLFNYHDLFQAKAQILQEPFEELVKYIDVPGVAIGDLFYIENLVAAIDAPSGPQPSVTATPTPTAKPGDTNHDGSVNILDLSILLTNFGLTVTPNTNGDVDGDGIVNLSDLALLLSNFGR